MFTNTLRRCSLQREILADIRRQISKTSSAPNSDAMALRKEDDRTKTVNTRWFKRNKQNNLRALSTLQTKIVPQAPATAFATKQESYEFLAAFPEIVKDLNDKGKSADAQEISKWYDKISQDGGRNRGLAVVTAYKMLEDPKKLTLQNVRLANIMGWCVEMFQSFLAATKNSANSDINVSWYNDEEIGLKPTNTSTAIESCLNTILNQYFSSSPVYEPSLKLFKDAMLMSAMGQTLDFFSKTDGRPNLDTFTMSRYNTMVEYKMAYNKFYLPVALGMQLASKYDPEVYRQARTILLELGHFSQVQDDFLDCFESSTVTNKYIRNGDCTWLAVVALQRCKKGQRKLMEECYGKPEAEAISAVKNLYDELGLPVTYSMYEEESYNLIRTHIQQISRGLPHEMFFKFLESAYTRQY